MEGNNNKYWKGVEELQNDPSFVKNAHNEFPEFLPVGENGSEADEISGTHRRDFLKLLGFGVAAATLAACEAPVKKAIPYLNKPEEIDPSVANWYASSYVDGGDYCSVLVKTREGRPIKIEGNKYSSVTKGGVSARVQASVLSLYDNERLKGPQAGGKASTWADVDKNIKSQLEEIAVKGGQIRIVSSTILSPSTKAAIADFTRKYPTTKHVVYDANSSSAILQANQISFGKAALPSYDFSKADKIVSIGADFLGTWISPVEFSKQYAVNRKVGKKNKTMSRHYQFETVLSLAGSNADHRTPIKPSQEGLVVAELYNIIAGNSISLPKSGVAYVEQAAKDLLASKGKSLVISSSNDVNVQLIVNAINQALGNYGTTLDIVNQANYRQGSDADVNTFINEVSKGSVDAVFFYNSNPLYSHPLASKLKTDLKKVKLSVSFALNLDETASECQFVCPDHHYLESWGDAEPKKGLFSLIQPTISPLFKTRQAQESLLAWSGSSVNFYNYVQEYWKSNIFPAQSKYTTLVDFWNHSLHNGVFELVSTATSSTAAPLDIASVTSAISKSSKATNGAIELALYEKVGMGNGNQANNPWLLELPDPISKACWDNYLAVPLSMAKAKSWAQDDIVKIQVGGTVIELPVLIQPGQAIGTVAIAIGYGREKAGKAGNKVGKNAYSLVVSSTGSLIYNNVVSSIEKTGETRKIAQTQIHQTIMGRQNVQESTLADYIKPNGKNAKGELVGDMAGRYVPMIGVSEGGNEHGKKAPEQISMWSSKPNANMAINHQWGMVIDLNSCIGCGSCVIGCQAENNVPVVGRQEVINSREMHWIRIDRYYTTDSPLVNDKSISGLLDKGSEIPAENPKVVFQPMMCQHCNNAPCETVCPVLATTHSMEGLNQMTYNRCIGTRYCANNCPYKVRRFNWFSYYNNSTFDYNMNDSLGKMVLNPDVTVRARGVMEKCSMCVQRIQEGKLTAKKASRRPIDGEIETACSQSCPTDAIVFGDMNDPESNIAKLLNAEKEGRSYHVLEEINVNPSVSYLSKIRNPKA
jgi:molybdopterin-containing oxidoreductase family iron-sulfur binding subunit